MEDPEAIARTLRERARALLPAIYFDPGQYDLLAQMTAPDDLGFYRALVAERGPVSVLELGCGTGRVALELCREGAEVVGVELSEALLEAARAKAEAEGLGPTLALGDLRSCDLGRTFDLVLMPYNVLNHMLDDASLADALEAARRHLAHESRLVIDTFQPSPAFLGGEPQKRRPILRYLDPYLDKEVVLSEEHHYDPATQVDRIVWSYAVDGTQDARVEELTMRLFFPRELDAWVERSGLVIEHKLGDYDRRPFDGASPKQLLVCRRA